MDELTMPMIYNLLVGVNDRLSYEKVPYAIALLRQSEVLEALRECDKFKDVIEYALKKKPSLFNEINIREVNVDANNALGIGMINKLFDLDEEGVDAYYSPNMMQMNEAIKLGKMIKWMDNEELIDYFKQTCKKIVVLDAITLGEDISLDRLKNYGELIVYPTTTREQTVERLQGVSYVFTNKVVLDKQILDQLPDIEYIGILATGTNNVDLAYCKEKGITVKNVAGYSTNTVAEHTLALALSLSHHIAEYDHYVKSKQYSQSGIFTCVSPAVYELEGKTWGIIGLGAIGKKVANIVSALGCKVIYYSTSNNHNDPDYERVDLETLMKQSDIVSIHAPLNDATYHLVDHRALNKMKKTAFIINVGRGPIIKEKDLAFALKYNMIAGAALDVFEEEPLSEESELLGLNNILFSPHSAWASVEARNRLFNLALAHFKDYLQA